MAAILAVSGNINQNNQSLRQRLREDTRAAHEQIDEKFGSLDLTTCTGLSSFLEAHIVAYAAIDVWCPALRDVIDHRMTLLEEDLSVLKTGLDQPVLDPISAAPHETGIRYVILGSQLGARLLRRQWAKSDDPDVLGAGRFLNSDDQADLWKTFVSELSAAPANGDVADDIIASANTTFDVFFKAFELTQRKLQDACIV